MRLGGYRSVEQCLVEAAQQTQRAGSASALAVAPILRSLMVLEDQEGDGAPPHWNLGAFLETTLDAFLPPRFP